MAIKVGGTTVIDDSRQLSNIASVDATTVAALGAAGVGGGAGSADLTASGAIADNDFVCLNSDGTVSSIQITKAASTDIDASAQVTINSDAGNSSYTVRAEFDPNNSNKILVGWIDYSDTSDRLVKVVCGTISGETITFGSVTLVYADGTNISSTDLNISFDPNTANQFLVSYKDNTNSNGKVHICSLSGTTITVGSAQTWTSQSPTNFKMMFDKRTANRFAAVFKGTSNYTYAVAGTISSGTISMGSEVTIEAGTTYQQTIDFDPNTDNKFIAGFTTASKLEAKVCTLSGTTITAGTAQGFVGGRYNSNPVIRFNTNVPNQIIGIYNDSATSPASFQAQIGTVSGTTITYASQVQIHNSEITYPYVDFDPNDTTKLIITFADDRVGGSGKTGFISLCTLSGTTLTAGNLFEHEDTNAVGDHIGLYDQQTANQFLMFYDETTNGEVAYKAAYTYTANLTQSNFLGFADGAASDTATATVKLRNNVYTTSGLTSGTIMYVQKDGTLSSSPDSVVGPVLGGTALTSTSLLVQNAVNPPTFDYNLTENAVDLSGKSYYDVFLPAGRKVAIEMLGLEMSTTTRLRLTFYSGGSQVTYALNYMTIYNAQSSGQANYVGDTQGNMNDTSETTYYQISENLSSTYNNFIGYIEIVDRQDFTFSAAYQDYAGQTRGDYAKGFIIPTVDTIRIQPENSSSQTFNAGKIRVRLM